MLQNKYLWAFFPLLRTFDKYTSPIFPRWWWKVGGNSREQQDERCVLLHQLIKLNADILETDNNPAKSILAPVRFNVCAPTFPLWIEHQDRTWLRLGLADPLSPRFQPTDCELKWRPPARWLTWDHSLPTSRGALPISKLTFLEC